MDPIDYKSEKAHVFAFLIGLFSVTNVMYAFTVGSTNISIVIILAVICDIFFIVSGKGKMINIFNLLPVSLRYFYVAIIVSLVPAVMFSTQYLYRWIVGVIYVLLLLSIIMAVYYLRNSITSIIYGISAGIIANVVLVFYEFLNYSSGRIFRLEILTKLFPNSYQHVANTYNAFRGMGFFLEPGHLARFLAIYALLVFGWLYNRNRRFAWSIIAIASIGIFSTRSAVIVYYVVGIVLLVILSIRNDKNKLLHFFMAGIAACIIAFLAIRYITLANIIWTSLVSGFTDMKVASVTGDTSSTIRKQGIEAGLSIIKQYPIFGVGWNEFTTHMMLSGTYSTTNKVFGSYSGIISMVGQLGVGAFFYVFYLLSNFVKNVKESETWRLCVGICFLMTFVIFCTTDLNYTDAEALLFGLVVFMEDDNNDYN